jgi:hypothetical protein
MSIFSSTAQPPAHLSVRLIKRKKSNLFHYFPPVFAVPTKEINSLIYYIIYIEK